MTPPAGDVSTAQPRTGGLVSVAAGLSWPLRHHGHNVHSQSVWRQTHPMPVKRFVFCESIYNK